jgi:hypothetical protein
MRFNSKFSGAVAALAVAAAIMAPAASARPVVDRPVVTCDPSAVPPPPSSIAASAAKDYAILRGCQAQAVAATVAPAPAAETSPPAGFDWVSATIGAVVAAGLSLVFATALGMRRRTGRPRRAAFS